jgi:cation diffusion facilitator CzcD-associated flavoprotein CzcO
MDEPIEDTRESIGLAALERRLFEDLACLNPPAEDWVPPTPGAAVADVVIIGGGMCGLVAWFAFTQAGLRNIRIVDRAAPGREGPWVTYARMETLRSPKSLTGPALGVPTLTFRAWFVAQHGLAAWQRLERIPRPQWMDYLRWYRRVLAVPVENGIEVTSIRPHAGGEIELEIASGERPAIVARKVVLATGREGLGDAGVPAFMAPLERHRQWAHSSDPIDFLALRGKRLAVIGVGASAVDNAAEALEAGASEVRLLARRPTMPTVNKLMGVGSYGMIAGFAEMTPEWRWRISDYAARQQTPAPHNSTLRVSRHPNAYFHFNCSINSMTERDGAIVITTRDGRGFNADFVILGTGFTIDPRLRPELREVSDRVACWEDRYTPPPGEANPELGRYPWLANDFSFTERVPGEAPWLADVHCFNYAAAMSLGEVSGDIPGISEGARWLARSLSAQLFNMDIDKHWAALQAYAKPELDGSEWTDADAAAATRHDVANGETT